MSFESFKGINRGEILKSFVSLLVTLFSVAVLAQSSASTSTTTAPAQDSIASRIKGSLVLWPTWNRDVLSNVSTAQMASVNYLSVGFKIDEKSTLGMRSYFGLNMGPEVANRNQITDDIEAITFSQEVDGIFGSEKFSPMFFAFLPTNEALRSIRSNGILRADAEITWNLNPRWATVVYVSGRQSFVPRPEITKEVASTDSSAAQASIGTPALAGEGKDVAVLAAKQSLSSLVYAASLAYNVNDKVQPYAQLGFRHRGLTAEGMKSVEDTAMPEVGVNLGINKHLNMALAVNQEVALKQEGVIVNERNWLAADQLTYNLVMAISL